MEEISDQHAASSDKQTVNATANKPPPSPIPPTGTPSPACLGDQPGSLTVGRYRRLRDTPTCFQQRTNDRPLQTHYDHHTTTTAPLQLTRNADTFTLHY